MLTTAKKKSPVTKLGVGFTGDPQPISIVIFTQNQPRSPCFGSFPSYTYKFSLKLITDV